MKVDMDKMVSLCKRRGFVFPNAEPYSGLSGFWDYGPYGVERPPGLPAAGIYREQPPAARICPVRYMVASPPAGTTGRLE